MSHIPITTSANRNFIDVESYSNRAHPPIGDARQTDMRMRLSARVVLAATVAVITAPAAGLAHFKLLEPASWLVEGERGDPQKPGPSGAANDQVPLRNPIGKPLPPSQLHL